MTTATQALELNAAALRVVSAAGAPAPVPGIANYEGDAVLVGREAAARMRLAPLWTSTRHFEELSTDPLPRAKPFARSHADLVYAQLAALVESHGLGAGRVVVAAGSGASLEQLRLFLGIAAAAKVDVAGVVDAAVAAAVDRASAPRAFHLDVELHRAVLTELVRGEELRRARVDVARSAGLRAYEDAYAQLLARLFVRATRFDPLHQAITEQALYDRLPEWIALAGAGEAQVVLEHGGLRHETALTAPQVVAAAAPLNAELVRLVHSARRAGEAATLYVTDRVAALPGIADELAKLRDCEVVTLPPGAAAAGALAHAGEIESAAGELALVNRLQGAAAVLPSRPAAAAARAPGALPTHLVYQGRAYALGAEPLVVGREPAAGPRAVVVAGGVNAGISRSHCTLVSRGGEAVLEDHSSYGTFLNGERVQRRARLSAGDRIRVGTPGVELELVRIEG